jgi:sarcosine oxidase subunit delta
MLILDCPFCGPRYHAEFTYGGDAGRRRPAHDDPDPARWHDHVFLRDNPRGPHREHWQHVHGCRAWLVVERDTLTHEILHVAAARPQQASGPEPETAP